MSRERKLVIGAKFGRQRFNMSKEDLKGVENRAFCVERVPRGLVD